MSRVLLDWYRTIPFSRGGEQVPLNALSSSVEIPGLSSGYAVSSHAVSVKGYLSFSGSVFSGRQLFSLEQDLELESRR